MNAPAKEKDLNYKGYNAFFQMIFLSSFEHNCNISKVELARRIALIIERSKLEVKDASKDMDLVLKFVKDWRINFLIEGDFKIIGHGILVHSYAKLVEYAQNLGIKGEGWHSLIELVDLMKDVDIVFRMFDLFRDFKIDFSGGNKLDRNERV